MYNLWISGFLLFFNISTAIAAVQPVSTLGMKDFNKAQRAENPKFCWSRPNFNKAKSLYVSSARNGYEPAIEHILRHTSWGDEISSDELLKWLMPVANRGNIWAERTLLNLISNDLKEANDTTDQEIINMERLLSIDSVVESVGASARRGDQESIICMGNFLESASRFLSNDREDVSTALRDMALYRSITDQETLLWIYEAAKAGNSMAQRHIAITLCRRGLSELSLSSDEKKLWMIREAKKGDVEAQVYISFYGRSLLKSTSMSYSEAVRDEEIVRWVVKGAKRGKELAQTDIGNMIAEGKLFPRGSDVTESERTLWVIKSAKKDSIIAQKYVGDFIARGNSIPREITITEGQKITWVIKAAKAGNTRAQKYVGDFIARGNSIPREITITGPQKITWIIKAAKAGNIRAQKYVGVFISLEKSLPRPTNVSDSEKRDWVKSAAREGIVGAKIYMGKVLAENSRSLHKSPPFYDGGITVKEKLSWIYEAARNGELVAQKYMGKRVAREPEFPKNVSVTEEEKKTWVVKFARDGDVTAQRYVGKRIDQGEFFSMTTRAEDREWLSSYKKMRCEQARKGDKSAQLKIAQIFIDSQYSERDKETLDERTLGYIIIAAKSGNKEAQYYLGKNLARRNLSSSFMRIIHRDLTSTEKARCLIRAAQGVHSTRLKVKVVEEKARRSLSSLEAAHLDLTQEEKVFWAIAAGKSGKKEAQVYMGNLLCQDYSLPRGTGVSRDNELLWIVVAARRGKDSAETYIGNILAEGSYLPRSAKIKEAEHILWVSKSAKKGNHKAKESVVKNLVEGKGVGRVLTLRDQHQLLENALKQDDPTPDLRYFMGLHYLNDGQTPKGFELLKQSYLRGYQSSFPHILRAWILMGNSPMRELLVWGESYKFKETHLREFRKYAASFVGNHSEVVSSIATGFLNLGEQYYREEEFMWAYSFYSRSKSSGHRRASIKLSEVSKKIADQAHEREDWDKSLKFYLKANEYVDDLPIADELYAKAYRAATADGGTWEVPETLSESVQKLLGESASERLLSIEVGRRTIKEKELGWIQKAAEDGYLNAKRILGDRAKQMSKWKEMVRYYEPLSLTTPALAYELALIYKEGKRKRSASEKENIWDIEPSDAKYHLYMLRAAEGEHIDSYEKVGQNFVDGWGIGRDIEEGIRWFNKALEAGRDTNFEIAQAYWKKGEKERAKEYYMRVSEGKSEYKTAVYWLGCIEEDERDTKKARKWFEKGAQLDHLESIYRLGRLYERGQGGVNVEESNPK